MNFFSAVGARVKQDATNQYEVFMSHANMLKEDYFSKVEKHGRFGAITQLNVNNPEVLKTAAVALFCFASYCFFSPYVTVGATALAFYVCPRRVGKLAEALIEEAKDLKDQYVYYNNDVKSLEADEEAQELENNSKIRADLLVSGVYFGAKLVVVLASTIFKFRQTVAVCSGLALGLGALALHAKGAQMWKSFTSKGNNL